MTDLHAPIRPSATRQAPRPPTTGAVPARAPHPRRSHRDHRRLLRAVPHRHPQPRPADPVLPQRHPHQRGHRGTGPARAPVPGTGRPGEDPAAPARDPAAEALGRRPENALAAAARHQERQAADPRLPPVRRGHAAPVDRCPQGHGPARRPDVLHPGRRSAPGPVRPAPPQAAGRQADIDKRVHPHGFRHTFAVELLQAGVDVATISKLLGHSSIAVTARYLDHLTNHQAVTALEAVDLPPLGA